MTNKGGAKKPDKQAKALFELYRLFDDTKDLNHLENNILIIIKELTSERDELEKREITLIRQRDTETGDMLRAKQELQKLKKAVGRHLDAFTPIDVQRTRNTLEALKL